MRSALNWNMTNGVGNEQQERMQIYPISLSWAEMVGICLCYTGLIKHIIPADGDMGKVLTLIHNCYVHWYPRNLQIVSHFRVTAKDFGDIVFWLTAARCKRDEIPKARASQKTHMSIPYMHEQIRIWFLILKAVSFSNKETHQGLKAHRSFRLKYVRGWYIFYGISSDSGRWISTAGT